MTKPCGFSERRLIAEAFGEATAELDQQVRRHVAGCALCSERLEQYRTLRARLRAWPAPTGEAAGLRRARQALEARLCEPQRPGLRVQLWHSPVGHSAWSDRQRGGFCRVPAPRRVHVVNARAPGSRAEARAGRAGYRRPRPTA